MGVEIERKWLVPAFPSELESVQRERIMQGYLVVGEDGSEVRVRRGGDRQSITYKSGGGLTRTEIVVDLSAEQFDQLWEATDGRRVVKTRINLEGGVDVDIFDGELSGLITAEVEFESEAAAEAFQPPKWFGADVTEDRAYKNQNLAVKGIPQTD